MESLNEFVVLRGPSGAGKTTLVNDRYPGAIVCSADNYFIKDGVYEFDRQRLKQAHEACKEDFYQALNNQAPLIVLDNTNTMLWEFEPYINLARLRGYKVTVIRIIADPEDIVGRNVHGVPNEVVLAQHERFEDYKGEDLLDAYCVEAA